MRQKEHILPQDQGAPCSAQQDAYSLNIDTIFKSKNINIVVLYCHKIGSDTSDHPTINTMSCYGNVDDVDVNFHGGLSWIYDAFSGIVESRLKEMLKNAVSVFPNAIPFLVFIFLCRCY